MIDADIIQPTSSNNDYVSRLTTLDLDESPMIEQIARLIREMFDLSAVFISLSGAEGHAFYHVLGLPTTLSITEQKSILAILSEPVITTSATNYVQDTRQNSQLRDTLIVNQLGILSYVAVPLTTAEEHVIGVLGVMDNKPRDWTDEDMGLLKNHAMLIVLELEQQSQHKMQVDTHQALQIAYQQTWDTLDSIRDAFFTIDNHWQITYINKAAQVFIQTEEHRLDIQKAFPENVAHAFKKAHDRVIKSNKPASFTEYHDPLAVWFEVRIYPHKSGVSVYFRDVTDHKHAEEVIRDALIREIELNELKSRFVSMASHEFRTPMATIQASVQSLERYHDRMTEEQKAKRYQKIRNQIAHMTSLLDDVLIIGKIEANAIEINPEIINLNGYTQSIIEEFQDMGIEHLIIYACDEPDDVEIFADTHLLHRILTNLISNAIKYSPDKSPIHVDINKKDDLVTFTVKDEGIGIPEEDHTKLFTKFFRASNVTGIPGSGLGLAITKHAVERHGGSVSFQSKVDEGTTFTVDFPLYTH